MQHLAVLHRQPPSQGVERTVFPLVGGHQLEDARHVLAGVELSDTDQLHLVVGFDQHAGDPGIGGNTGDGDVLSTQGAAQPGGPVLDLTG